MGTVAAPNPLDQPTSGVIPTTPPADVVAQLRAGQPGVGFAAQPTAPPPAVVPPTRDQVLDQAASRIYGPSNSPTDPVSMADFDVISQKYPMAKGGSMSDSGGVSQSTQQVAESPALQAQRAKEYAAQMEVVKKRMEQGNVAAQGAAAVAQEADAQVDAMAQVNADWESRKADWEKRQKSLFDENRKKNDQYVEEAKNLDPNRLMHGGNRVIAGISIALGAFGASIRNGRNFAQDIINDAIEKDYQLQKDHLSASKEGASLSRQVLQDARALFQDEQSAFLIYKGNMQSVLAAKIQAAGARLGSEEAKAAAATESAKLEALAEENKTKGMQVSGSKSIGQTETRQRTATGGTALTQEDVLKTLAAEAELADKRDKGKPDSADVEHKKKFLERLEGGAEFFRRMDEVQERLKDTTLKGAGDTSDNAKFLEQTLDMAVAAKTRADSGAQANEAEAKRNESLIRGRSWTSAQAAREAAHLKHDVAQSLHTAYQGLHGRHQREMLERLRTAGYPDEFVNEVASGKAGPPQGDSAVAGGAAMGATPRKPK